MPTEKDTSTDKLKSLLVGATGLVRIHHRSPDEELSSLLADIQSAEVFADGKTFVDLVPRKRARFIEEEYNLAKQDPNFDIREFISRHFYDLKATIHKKPPLDTIKGATIDEYITNLWGHLERRNRRNRGSLLALPYTYVVPGGRFNEQFYWDSYFIMLGLAAEDKWTQVENMVKNCSYMIRRYGYIPTANRSYFLNRSQPPFFVMMVRLLAQHKGKKIIRSYLPYLVDEYKFWMRGRRKLANTPHSAHRRLVQMPDGSLLNRYYSDNLRPRAESLNEDTQTAAVAKRRQADRLFLHLRAGAESGWDFSSRWFNDGVSLESIHTADIIPVDLNSLLYILEETIADGYNTFSHPLIVRRYRKAAQRRKKAMQKYLWNQHQHFYMDYNFHRGKFTGVYSLAAAFPLWAGLASNEQAAAVADKLKKDFLKPGGLVTTLNETGQQWDAPNGWAPLQWIAIEGLSRYGYTKLAGEVSHKWLSLNEDIFKQTGMLYEKYDVVNRTIGMGGEYVIQEGFGWTNGVYGALKRSFHP